MSWYKLGGLGGRRRYVVKVDLIHAKLLHTNVTTNLHFNMHTFTIFALILNTHDYVAH
jgi:hypothetical protein